MAAAVPFALKAGAAIGGSWLGKKLAGPSKLQQTATAGTQQTAQQVGSYAPGLMHQGTELTGQGANYLGKAGDYYSNILSNRRSASESLAPERTTALDYYRGAEGKTSRTMRGGSRDYALAELDRGKVGTLAGMLPAARANAAQGAANVGGNFFNAGSSATGQGVNAATNAAYINSGLFNQASQLQQQQQAGGKQWGGLLYDLMQQMPWGRGKGGGGIFSNVPYGASPPVSRGY